MQYYVYSEDDIEKVLLNNDIVDVISQYVDLKRTGSSYKGLCPFHNEKTPSFTVSPSKQLYHCFGCGEGGDVINFIMKKNDLSFLEAVEFLADRAGIVLDKKIKKSDNKARQQKEILYRINREAAIFFYKNLIDDKIAQSYLKIRQIDMTIVKKFGLGYSLDRWDGLYTYLKKKGFDDEQIFKSGLVKKSENNNKFYDTFRNRIMFPIIDLKGNVVGFGGRIIGNAQPKYLNSPETPVFSKGYNLYGLNIAKNFGRKSGIILVEGYMDVISLYKNGIKNSVASLGTALTHNQAKLLKRYSDNIYICYDADDAGFKAANKALDKLKEQGINSKVLLIKNGMDPDDYIKQYGKSEFEKLKESSLSYIDFKIHFYKTKYNLDDLEEKIKFTKEISNVLSSLKSTIEIDAYIDKLSHETNISTYAIKSEIYGKNNNTSIQNLKDKYINKFYRNNKDKITPVNYKVELGHFSAEKGLLSLIINNKNMFDKIKSKFNPEDFTDIKFRQIAHVIYELYENQTEISFNDIKKFFDIETINIVKEIFDDNNNLEEDEINKAMEDYINKINYYKLKNRKKLIKDELRKIQVGSDNISKGDVEKSKYLLNELTKIEQKLKMHQ